MASKRSKTDLAPDWTGPRIVHADAVDRLTVRRGTAGATDPPRNAGKNRTASKKALLAAIEKAGGCW